MDQTIASAADFPLKEVIVVANSNTQLHFAAKF
jgi:hypothetical protein